MRNARPLIARFQSLSNLATPLRIPSCSCSIRSFTPPPALHSRCIKPFSSLLALRPVAARPGEMGSGGANPRAVLDVEALPAEFDKEQFRQSTPLKALVIPAKQCQHYVKLLNKHLLHRPRMKNIVDIPGDKNHRMLLLEESLLPEAFPHRMVAPPAGAKDQFAPLSLQDIIDRDGLSVADSSIEIDYTQISAVEALRRLLPAGAEVPSSFEQVGHIAHMNLRDELLPYRRIVGAVLLDKNPKIRTVINKVGSIDNEWRVFAMEVLAGDDETLTEVRQHGLRYRLDFRKVYWNSRLEAEHSRLVGRWFNPDDVVMDAMAGIGPFAVPAAKKGCRVFANDLNPESYRWLVENIGINRVADAVSPYKLDGREFMRQAAGGKLAVAWAPAPAKKVPQKKKGGAAEGADGDVTAPVDDGAAARAPAFAPAFQHLVMNLPATAVEFLDALNGAFDPEMWEGRDLPLVHVYAFLKKDETLQDLQRRIEAALGGPLDSSPDFYSVRDVAPNKQMYCATFRVPVRIAFKGEDAKRQRVA